MIKTVIVPENTDIHLSVPNSYVGKKVEVLLYTVDEAKETTEPSSKKMADFKGILTASEAEQLQEYVKTSREEWDRDI